MTPIRTTPLLFPLAVVLLLHLGAVQPALAQDRTGGTFELFAGWYMPETSALGDDLTYGLRGGYRFSDAFGFEGSVSSYQADLGNSSFGIDFFFLDTSFKWYPGSGGKQNELVLFGGPGWALIDINIDDVFFGLSLTEDSVTAHVGLAGELHLSDSVYLRPDARARWIEQTEDVDLEVTLAVGFRF